MKKKFQSYIINAVKNYYKKAVSIIIVAAFVCSCVPAREVMALRPSEIIETKGSAVGLQQELEGSKPALPGGANQAAMNKGFIAAPAAGKTPGIVSKITTARADGDVFDADTMKELRALPIYKQFMRIFDRPDGSRTELELLDLIKQECEAEGMDPVSYLTGSIFNEDAGLSLPTPEQIDEEASQYPPDIVSVVGGVSSRAPE